MVFNKPYVLNNEKKSDNLSIYTLAELGFKLSSGHLSLIF